jgi:hypothetical protein
MIYRQTHDFNDVIIFSGIFSAISIAILWTIPEARMKHHPLPATGETPPVA